MAGGGRGGTNHWEANMVKTSDCGWLKIRSSSGSDEKWANRRSSTWQKSDTRTDIITFMCLIWHQNLITHVWRSDNMTDGTLTVERSTKRGNNWTGGARGGEMSVLVVTRRGGEFLKIPFHSFCMSWITFPLSIAGSFRNTADENIACVCEREREREREISENNPTAAVW